MLWQGAGSSVRRSRSPACAQQHCSLATIDANGWEQYCSLPTIDANGWAPMAQHASPPPATHPLPLHLLYAAHFSVGLPPLRHAAEGGGCVDLFRGGGAGGGGAPPCSLAWCVCEAVSLEARLGSSEEHRECAG